MSNDSLRGKILEVLAAEQGLTDEELTVRLKDWTRSEATVNLQCRRLEEEGLLKRIKRIGRPAGNYLIQDESAPPTQELAAEVDLSADIFEIPSGSIHLPAMIRLGFRPAGDWYGSDNHISYQVNSLGDLSNVLYAFVVDGTVVYIRRTLRSLSHAMGQLQSGHCVGFQVRVHGYLRGLLKRGREVKIYVLPDPGNLQYGGYRLSLAAGLEPALLDSFKPIWNMKDEAA